MARLTTSIGRMAPAALAVAALLAGCSSSGTGTTAATTPATGSRGSAPGSTTPGATTPGTAPGTGATTPGTGTTGGSTPGTEPTVRRLSDQFGVRYCEVLTVTLDPEHTTAEVWGTQNLNDCPQEQFAGIDPAKVRDEMGVTAAIPNGPRYWVLDSIVANQLAGSLEIRSFNGIDMRSIAVVDLGTGLPDRRPYIPVSVRRDTEFGFEAGRTIYEVVAPDGETYVMQSYSLEVDPNLTVDQLAGLGSRLQLPEGWRFVTRTLTEELVVEDVDGVATVLQDELRNSYQGRGKG